MSADWTYKGKKVDSIPEEYEGFVYLITNTKNGKKYIGKKLAKFKTTKPPLKGRKNKRRGHKESDWRTYWGSSDYLNEDVANLGESSFTREILDWILTSLSLHRSFPLIPISHTPVPSAPIISVAFI